MVHRFAEFSNYRRFGSGSRQGRQTSIQMSIGGKRKDRRAIFADERRISSDVGIRHIVTRDSVRRFCLSSGCQQFCFAPRCARFWASAGRANAQFCPFLGRTAYPDRGVPGPAGRDVAGRKWLERAGLGLCRVHRVEWRFRLADIDWAFVICGAPVNLRLNLAASIHDHSDLPH